jgi:hypothetical protein
MIAVPALFRQITPAISAPAAEHHANGLALCLAEPQSVSPCGVTQLVPLLAQEAGVVY